MSETSSRPRRSSRNTKSQSNLCDRILLQGQRNMRDRLKKNERRRSESTFGLGINKDSQKRVFGRQTSTPNTRWHINVDQEDERPRRRRFTLPKQPVSPPTVPRGPSILHVQPEDDEKKSVETIGQCLVIDQGSFSIKAGFAGHPRPQVSLRTSICRQPSNESLHFGEDAFVQHRRKPSESTLSSPITRGVIDDWESIGYMWEHFFGDDDESTLLDVDTSECSFLFTEPPLSCIRARERLVQEMFTRYEDIPRLGIMVQSVLSLYATKRRTGMVVDLGFHTSSIVPCMDGVAVPLKGKKMSLGGFDLTKHLNRCIFRTLVTPEALEMGQRYLRDIKETHGEVNHSSRSTTTNSFSYSLPDGNRLTIARQNLLDCSEMFFNPRTHGFHHDGISDVILSSVADCDESFQKELLENVVLVGGSSLLTGMGDRLREEICLKMGDPEFNFGVSQPGVHSSEDRDVLSWIGGSIFASTAAADTCFITNEEFEEHGSCIVHKKFCG